MAERNVFNKLVPDLEEVFHKNGVNCIRVSGADDFLRKMFEHEMLYKGFVVLSDGSAPAIFYLDTFVEPAYKNPMVQILLKRISGSA